MPARCLAWKTGAPENELEVVLTGDQLLLDCQSGMADKGRPASHNAI